MYSDLLVGFVSVRLFRRFWIVWGFVDERWVLVEAAPGGVDLGWRGVEGRDGVG